MTATQARKTQTIGMLVIRLIDDEIVQVAQRLNYISKRRTQSEVDSFLSDIEIFESSLFVNEFTEALKTQLAQQMNTSPDRLTLEFWNVETTRWGRIGCVEFQVIFG
jgi:hypothetical protein